MNKQKVLSEKKADYTEIYNECIEPLGEDYIPVCFCSSNEYAPILSVALQSLIINRDEKQCYDIVIINRDISENNKALLHGMIDGLNNIYIRFLNIKKWVENLTFYTWAHFTAFTYYRLIIPTLFKNYEKVIYLDSDVVVNHDISELYKSEINKEYIAAVIDTHVTGRFSQLSPKYEPSYYTEVLGCLEGEYFQAGVMLINISEINECYGDMELVKKASEAKYRWLDQDFLNIEFHGKVKYLQNNWNVMILNTPNDIDEDYLRKDLFEKYNEARREPYIIHYVGRSIPCYVPTTDMYYYFWRYARLTPYYELLLSMIVSESEKRTSRRMISIKSEMISYYNERRPMARLKRKIIDPIIIFIFPKGTKRRDVVRSCWWKLIGRVQ